jgi:F-type H+/Na+-transporting ATPase subunit alpha
VSAYIPTNVISITDGQCFLETDLFNAGVRPAINVGISVSRVGGAAQSRAMKDVAGRLRVDLAQYRELEAFAAFGSDLDRASQQQLARGARMTELLKQPAASPFAVEREIVSIWAGTTGKLDNLEVRDVRTFEEELHNHIAHSEPQIFSAIVETGKLEDDTIAALERAVDEVKRQFELIGKPAEARAETSQADTGDTPADENAAAGAAETPAG